MGYLLLAYLAGAAAGGLLGRSLGMMAHRRSGAKRGPDPRRWTMIGATVGGIVSLGWFLLLGGRALLGF